MIFEGENLPTPTVINRGNGKKGLKRGGDYNSAYQTAHDSAAKLDASGANHGDLDVNNDRSRNMIQVRKTGTQTWIDLGTKSK